MLNLSRHPQSHLRGCSKVLEGQILVSKFKWKNKQPMVGLEKKRSRQI
jgi:hypothetical protein